MLGNGGKGEVLLAIVLKDISFSQIHYIFVPGLGGERAVMVEILQLFYIQLQFGYILIPAVAFLVIFFYICKDASFCLSFLHAPGNKFTADSLR